MTADELRAATEAWRTHARGERDARPDRDAAILAAVAAGIPHREIAAIVGDDVMTYGRVGQLARAQTRAARG